MKQIAQNYKSGELSVLDVPAPVCRPGGVLVQSLFSLISTGTEMMKLTEAKMSMVGKARARPDQVRKVLDTVAQQGAVATYKKVMNRLDSYTPLGYSLCGVVVEVGPRRRGVPGRPAGRGRGQRVRAARRVQLGPVQPVRRGPQGGPARARRLLHRRAPSPCTACGGPRSSWATPPASSASAWSASWWSGSWSPPGSGSSGWTCSRSAAGRPRRPAPTCAPRPPTRAWTRSSRRWPRSSGGRGADHLFLAAGGSSNGPVEAAARLARDRARVVDIGKTRLDLPWNAYYDKELDVRFSRSYGPGRYDDRYELDGIDYPAGYVRWTERRNLECFLDLIARKEIEVETLISGRFPLEQASTVYADLASGSVNAVGVLLEYPAPADGRPARGRPAGSSRARRRAARSGKSGRLAIGFIGAGNYASSMLLPHLAKLDNAHLAHVATTRSLSAVNAQRRFGFTTASTTADAVLEDESLDAIFIVTRHHTHADLVCRALETGKAVFVEKPLALTDEELERVIDVVDKTGNDRLMVGFNRRFAPLLAEMKSRVRPAGTAARLTRYLVNAGPLAADSWYRNEELEGSRFTGEGGHFIDTLSWWAGSLPTEVYAARRPGEGRRAGHAAVRERLDRHHQLRHRRQPALSEGDARRRRRRPQRAAGQLQEGDGLERPAAERHEGARRPGQGPGDPSWTQFVEACRTGAPMPISVESLVATTRATIAVGESLLSGRPERV